MLRDSQETDDDGDQAGHSPEDSESLLAQTKSKNFPKKETQHVGTINNNYLPQAKEAICFQRQKSRE